MKRLWNWSSITFLNVMKCVLKIIVIMILLRELKFDVYHTWACTLVFVLEVESIRCCLKEGGFVFSKVKA